MQKFTYKYTRTEWELEQWKRERAKLPTRREVYLLLLKRSERQANKSLRPHLRASYRASQGKSSVVALVLVWDGVYICFLSMLLSLSLTLRRVTFAVCCCCCCYLFILEFLCFFRIVKRALCSVHALNSVHKINRSRSVCFNNSNETYFLRENIRTPKKNATKEERFNSKAVSFISA